MRVDGNFEKTVQTSSSIARKVKDVLRQTSSADPMLHSICGLLAQEVPYYDWVGFYLIDQDHEGQLVLGPYVGAPTEHVRIPIGKGICGQAAATGRVFLVPDVLLEENYLSCSPEVRSEIVVPIMRGEKVLGELDIDSHSIDPFDGWDRALLEAICEMVAPLI